MATQRTVRWPTTRGRRRGVRWLTAIAAGCFLAGAAAAVSRAEDPASAGLVVGTAYETSVALWGKQIPLPAGDWVLAGQGHEQVPGFEDLAYGAIESVV